MIKREEFLTNIRNTLTYLQQLITNNNALNLTNINIHAENFFRDLFNLLFVYSLKNTNFIKQNNPNIDLVDTKNKIAIQITSQNDNEKIMETIKGFFNDIEHPEYIDFKLELLLISKERKNYKTDFTEKGKYNFNKNEDIIDVIKLLDIISDKDINKIKEISDFLDKEVGLNNKKKENNEVETIMALLTWLSDDSNYKESDKDYICDPPKKINETFKEHSAFFKDEYLELSNIYNISVLTAKKEKGLDLITIKKISDFLKHKSNRFLIETNNNPQEAFYKLIDFFEAKLSVNGEKFDNGAIRYYILDELFGCNVFSEEIKC